MDPMHPSLTRAQSVLYFFYSRKHFVCMLQIYALVLYRVYLSLKDFLDLLSYSY